jgi:site-specific DNA-methyltransferase (adenine-specific)
MAKRSRDAKIGKDAQTPAVSRKSSKSSRNKAPQEPPAAALLRASRPSSLVDTRVVYCGDNLDQLKKLPDACVDLIYIDPPFNSNRNYEVFWGETKEKRAFEDRHASTQAYIDYMRPRCVQLKRVLKTTGSFYYHCDWHAGHYVKIMLDQLFGENNFLNEVIWKRTHAHGGARRFGPVHDTIFFYSGSDTWTWNPQYAEYSDEYKEKFFRFEDEEGRRYRLTILTGSGTRNGHSGRPWRGIDPTKSGRHWAVPGYARALLPNPDAETVQEALDQLDAIGRVAWPAKQGGVPSFKQYMDDFEGAQLQSVWTDIPPISAQAKERLGYPTQKPLALLERIIKASSNPNDIILDAFCGCGTALVAAQNLGRQWIGIDISPTACRVMAKRLRDACKLPENEKLWRVDNRRAFALLELPYSVKQLRDMPHFEFENWAVIALGGVPNTVQVGDMGIDGRIFPVGSRPSDAHSMFAGDWFPVQVKQVDKVGRAEIDSFEAVMEREDRARGFFVAFGYSAEAHAEAAAFFKRTKRVIKLITVQEILDEQHVEKM